MKNNSILQKLAHNKSKGYKSFAVLLDPDKTNLDKLDEIIANSIAHKVDYFFVGGSLITCDTFNTLILQLKHKTDIPVVLFPGSNLHIDFDADGILLLSLISGRNAELLIGQHVIAAPLLKKSSLEIIPTGYMLVDSGLQTTVSYISNTTPIPYDKPSIAACTAMAGEMLGLKLIYMDAGSGAQRPVSLRMIAAVHKSVDLPIVVGGGINTASKAIDALNAGADMIVIGNGIEQNPDLLIEVGEKINEMNSDLQML